MNDEIKKILDNIKEDINGKFEWEYIDGYYVEQIKPLLDYITNLQQENERLKDIVVEKDNQIKEMILQKTDYTAVNILEMKLEDYKSRCEKASEILKKLDLDKYTYTKENRKHTINNLLNILQNGSEKDDR